MSLLEVLTEAYDHKDASACSVVFAILEGCSHVEYANILWKSIEALDLVTLLITTRLAL